MGRKNCYKYLRRALNIESRPCHFRCIAVLCVVYFIFQVFFISRAKSDICVGCVASTSRLALPAKLRSSSTTQKEGQVVWQLVERCDDDDDEHQ